MLELYSNYHSYYKVLLTELVIVITGIESEINTSTLRIKYFFYKICIRQTALGAIFWTMFLLKKL